MSSDNAVKAAIVNALKADATLTSYLTGGTAGIYDSLAVEGIDPPYVTFALLTNVPQYTQGNTRAYENDQWLIKGITTGNSKALGGSISDRIYAALQDAALTVSGGSCLKSERAQKIDYEETDRGVRYHHIGGAYRIWTT